MLKQPKTKKAPIFTRKLFIKNLINGWVKQEICYRQKSIPQCCTAFLDACGLTGYQGSGGMGCSEFYYCFLLAFLQELLTCLPKCVLLCCKEKQFLAANFVKVYLIYGIKSDFSLEAWSLIPWFGRNILILLNENSIKFQYFIWWSNLQGSWNILRSLKNTGLYLLVSFAFCCWADESSVKALQI